MATYVDAYKEIRQTKTNERSNRARTPIVRRVFYQSEGFRNGVMLSLGALEYGVVGDGQVVLLLLLLLLRFLPACAAGELKCWPSNLISFRVYS